MYIALSQPAIPTMKATVKIVPIIEKPVQVRQENFWDSKGVIMVMLLWLIVSTITTIANLV